MKAGQTFAAVRYCLITTVRYYSAGRTHIIEAGKTFAAGCSAISAGVTFSNAGRTHRLKAGKTFAAVRVIVSTAIICFVRAGRRQAQSHGQNDRTVYPSTPHTHKRICLTSIIVRLVSQFPRDPRYEALFPFSNRQP